MLYGRHLKSAFYCSRHSCEVTKEGRMLDNRVAQISARQWRVDLASRKENNSWWGFTDHSKPWSMGEWVNWCTTELQVWKTEMLSWKAVHSVCRVPFNNPMNACVKGIMIFWHSILHVLSISFCKKKWQTCFQFARIFFSHGALLFHQNLICFVPVWPEHSKVGRACDSYPTTFEFPKRYNTFLMYDFGYGSNLK